MDSTNYVEEQVVIDSTGFFSVHLPGKVYELTFNEKTSQILVIKNFRAKAHQVYKIEVLLARRNDSTFHIPAEVTLPANKSVTNVMSLD